MYIGHAQALAALRQALPPVALLLGPPSIGKWTMTQLLADHHQVTAADRFVVGDGLTMDTARQLITFVGRAPFGELRLVQIRLDGARQDALNALLKTLEEPPDTARFLLTAGTPLPPTVISRTHVYRLGLLTDTEVRDILVDQGAAPVAAARAAAIGRGQVTKAMSALGCSDKAHDQVLSILRSIATGDRAAYTDKLFVGFDDNARTMLLVWLHEAGTGQWAAFTPDESYGLHTNRPRLRAMVLALSQFAVASPRLGVRAALEPFVPH